jgi:hypothetical protein
MLSDVTRDLPTGEMDLVVEGKHRSKYDQDTQQASN